jgi:hypothetical protein
MRTRVVQSRMQLLQNHSPNTVCFRNHENIDLLVHGHGAIAIPAACSAHLARVGLPPGLALGIEYPDPLPASLEAYTGSDACALIAATRDVHALSRWEGDPRPKVAELARARAHAVRYRNL